jgi:hypothetical protein
VDELAKHLKTAKEVIHFVKDHQMPLSIFREISKKELVLPAETRYASALVTVSRYAECADELEQLFASTKFKDWHKKQDADLRAKGDALKLVVNNAAFQSG